MAFISSLIATYGMTLKGLPPSLLLNILRISEGCNLNINTIMTMFGYVKSLAKKYVLLAVKSESISDIYNYLPITDMISTSGQPMENEFKLIKSQGFEQVINLAPHNAENSLKNEALTLNNLGMNYFHIPVAFDNPIEEDFEQFKDLLRENKHKKVWVHCAANMRVSAFIYRYRRSVLGESEDIAKADLNKIWQPFGAWTEFIKR